MLYRWFVGIPMHDEVWDHSSFTRNRDRLIEHDTVRTLFGEILDTAARAGLLSDEHFSIDGTLICAWASHKSMVPRDGVDPPDKRGPKSNAEVDFKGTKRTNATHVDDTVPDAMLATKSNREGAHLCYTGHALMENRNGLAVDCEVTQATGTAERNCALELIVRQPQATTPGPTRITIRTILSVSVAPRG